MNIYFDIDYTLVAVDGSLRPGTVELFRRLREDRHRLYIWSGMGVRTDEVRTHGLLELVSGVYLKPVEDFEVQLVNCQVDCRPDVVVDDHEDIVTHFGGVLVRPYFWPDQQDKDLERVYKELNEITQRLHGCDGPSP